jgi:hypothetical protein
MPGVLVEELLRGHVVHVHLLVLRCLCTRRHDTHDTNVGGHHAITRKWWRMMMVERNTT